MQIKNIAQSFMGGTHQFLKKYPKMNSFQQKNLSCTNLHGSWSVLLDYSNSSVVHSDRSKLLVIVRLWDALFRLIFLEGRSGSSLKEANHTI